MKLNWKWLLGIVLVLVLLALPWIWGLWGAPFGGYGMMRGYWNMPMMNYGYGMMPFGMAWMWLSSVGTLVLIGLGIVWLARQMPTKTE